MSIPASVPGGCPYILGLTRQSAAAGGASLSTDVIAPAGCAWSASSDAGWIVVTAGSGSGRAPLSYTVAANPASASRTGTLTVSGQVLTVVQDGLSTGN